MNFSINKELRINMPTDVNIAIKIITHSAQTDMSVAYLSRIADVVESYFPYSWLARRKPTRSTAWESDVCIFSRLPYNGGLFCIKVAARGFLIGKKLVKERARKLRVKLGAMGFFADYNGENPWNYGITIQVELDMCFAPYPEWFMRGLHGKFYLRQHDYPPCEKAILLKF